MCNEVLVGNKVGVVSCTARNQFAAEAGIFIDLEHVHADVGHAGIDHVGERQVPALKDLVRQSGDEIDIDIFNSSATKAGDIVDNRSPGVQTSNGSGLLVDE